MVSALKSLSDNFDIWIIAVLVSVDSLFSCEFWFSWSLVRPVIFSCTLDILNIILDESWSFLNVNFSRQLPRLGLAYGFCQPFQAHVTPLLLTTVRCGVGWLSWAPLKRLPPSTLDHHCHCVWVPHLVPVGILRFCSIGHRSEAFLSSFLIYSPYPWLLQKWFQDWFAPTTYQAPRVAYMGDKNGRTVFIKFQVWCWEMY